MKRAMKRGRKALGSSTSIWYDCMYDSPVIMPGTSKVALESSG